MSRHFADRLAEACRAKGNALCVGLDPRWEQLPQALRQRHARHGLEGMARAFEEFSLRVLELVAPFVPVVKPQSAFFEASGPAGLAALQKVLFRARELGLITILDSKRNDIASTAEAYADAAFSGVIFEGQRHPVWAADALTINPYLGRDGVEPFLVSARQTQGGVFVLVRTSNKGAGQFQDLRAEGKPLFEHVAHAVGAWAEENAGECRFGDVGAVVGATHPAELARLREFIPDVVFLVPGFGAQGGSAKDVAAAFRADGLGAIINSSRGIIAAFRTDDADWEEVVIRAVQDGIHVLNCETPMGNLRMR
ncbi:MAG: orotidine-5'-phosphate decarboxylase [Gemmataceae bacterium]|nr:orotidine-5'-phosphate decarboxylase [Gemmataceae bacterium]MCI0741180.1 orotidine-5'-phosphate decarboxylase [Gemmataceae bacterium]